MRQRVSFDWFHHPEMGQRIARAEADFVEGRFERTDTPDEAAALLDRWKRGGALLGDSPQTRSTSKTP